MDLRAINLLILDVDGVLTDGRLALGAEGEPFKVFSTLDGCAIRCWQRASHRTAILSGRKHPAVDRRARELGIGVVRDGVDNKERPYTELLAELNARDENVCYVGDDLLDLSPMSRCALPVAVSNAAGAVKRAARYVTQRRGGEGAVAEVIELVLRKQGRWSLACLPGT